jgi:hypothetical protein
MKKKSIKMNNSIRIKLCNSFNGDLVGDGFKIMEGKYKLLPRP